MLRIMSHIERLLLIHDCVIIPKVGGFVIQNHSAVYRREDNSFSPAQKEIVFNPTLQHNDGLLIESYMKMYGLNFSKAQCMLEEDIAVLQIALQKNKQISLGAVGSFCSEKEGKLIFIPASSAPFSISSYGLETFRLPTLKSLSENKVLEKMPAGKSAKHKEIFYIPVNRSIIRLVTASAAAVALFLLISTPVKTVNQDAYTASFIPTEVTESADTSMNASLVSSVAVSEESNLTTETVAQPEKPVEAAPAVVQSTEKDNSVSQNTKYYHVVISSLPSLKMANKVLSKLDKNRFGQAGIVERDGKVRLYAAKFTDKAEAEQYLSTLRHNHSYKDAWMFISR